MRFSVIILLIVLLLCYKNDLSAQQNTIVTAEFSQQSVASVLAQLSKSYDLRFAYDSYELRHIYGAWKFEAQPIDAVLQALLESTGWMFKWVDATAIIYHELDPIGIEKSPEEEETNHTILGEVRDFYTRELLPFAVLSNSKSGQVITTDADGKFTLLMPNQTTDSLEVFFVGYEVKNVALSFFFKKRYATILLIPARNYLPDVIIQSEGVRWIESSGKPGINTINPGSFATTQGTGEADILRTAQLLPGISATQESSNGLYIQGSNNDQTQISFDGFNLYHQDHFFGAFTAVNANAVKAMRIHKGITDARFGGRTAGIVEIIGKEGTLKRTTAQIDIGPLAVGAVVESPMDTLGKSSVILTARRAFTNVLYSPTYRQLFNTTYNAAVTSGDKNISQNFDRNNPDFYFQDLNLKFTYRPTRKDIINISGYASGDNLFVQYADSSGRELENPIDVKYTDESSKKNVGASSRWLRTWNNGWESEARIGWSRFTGSFFSVDTIHERLFQTDSIRFTSEQTALKDLDARFEMRKVFSGIKLNAGLEVNSISSGMKRNEDGKITADSLDRGIVYSVFISANNESEEKLRINPGIRINYYDRSAKFYFEPRLLMQFDLVHGKIKLKSSVGRVHQYVQRIQTQSLYLNTPDYWRMSGPESIPVLLSDQIMVGCNLYIRGWIIDVETYRKWNDGNILNTNSYINATGNSLKVLAGRGEAVGADILVMRNYRRHHIMLGYSLLKTSTDFPLDGFYNIPEIFEQRHEFKFNYEWHLKKWDLAVFWVYGSGRPYTPLLGTYDFPLPDGNSRKLPVYGELNSARLPAYHRMDFTVAWRFMLGKIAGSLQFSLFNVYNQPNVRDIQYRALRNSNNPNDFAVDKRDVSMLGFLPSLNLKLKF